MTRESMPPESMPREHGFPDRFPIDPDVDPIEDAHHHRGAAPAEAARTRWPTFRWSILGVIFVGGCAGGVARYLVTRQWTVSPSSFPWPTFAVNVAGAFVLALLIVVVSDVLRPTTHLRPLVGTGFCGALTTFSSIVVSADEMVAHGHGGLAATYLVTTLLSGLAAALAGVAVGRRAAATW